MYHLSQSSRSLPAVASRWVVDAIVESVMSSFDTDGDDTMDFKDFTKLVRSC